MRYKQMMLSGPSRSLERFEELFCSCNALHCRSLRRSIKTRRPDMTREDGVDSTVHVDVEYHELDGHPIRMFDCAGQVRHILFLLTLSWLNECACVVGPGRSVVGIEAGGRDSFYRKCPGCRNMSPAMAAWVVESGNSVNAGSVPQGCSALRFSFLRSEACHPRQMSSGRSSASYLRRIAPTTISVRLRLYLRQNPAVCTCPGCVSCATLSCRPVHRS